MRLIQPQPDKYFAECLPFALIILLAIRKLYPNPYYCINPYGVLGFWGFGVLASCFMPDEVSLC